MAPTLLACSRRNRRVGTTTRILFDKRTRVIDTLSVVVEQKTTDRLSLGARRHGLINFSRSNFFLCCCCCCCCSFCILKSFSSSPLDIIKALRRSSSSISPTCAVIFWFPGGIFRGVRICLLGRKVSFDRLLSFPDSNCNAKRKMGFRFDSRLFNLNVSPLSVHSNFVRPIRLLLSRIFNMTSVRQLVAIFLEPTRSQERERGVKRSVRVAKKGMQKHQVFAITRHKIFWPKSQDDNK